MVKILDRAVRQNAKSARPCHFILRRRDVQWQRPTPMLRTSVTIRHNTELFGRWHGRPNSDYNGLSRFQLPWDQIHLSFVL